MRDEFNHSPEGQKFSEYSMPYEESRLVDYTTPKEYVGVEELVKPRETSETNMASSLEDGNNHKKQKRKTKLMSYMVAASVAVLTVANAAIPESIAAVERKGQWGYANDVFEKKPQLPNLEPNGAVTVPEYGLYDVVLDEKFLIYGDGTYEYAIVAGERRVDLPVSKGTEEIYYDADTNTLHLNNCDIEYINANMMGNSFTIDVEGTCHVGYILVWGFYSGGSVTITGESGTLYINENNTYAMGIQLLAENSMSGVFIDEMKGLYVSGYESPIAIFDTTMEHPLYWKTAAMQLKEDYQYDVAEIYEGNNVLIGPYNTGHNTLSFLPVEQSTKDLDPHKNTVDKGTAGEKEDEVVSSSDNPDRKPDREQNQNGNTICQECNGTGKVIVVEELVKSVYNGTPCRICNDVGTVDDGMHGGVRAECGECLGYGTNHSVGDVDDGYVGFNGDYREYAFDEKTVMEEYSETCHTCGGRGAY